MDLVASDDDILQMIQRRTESPLFPFEPIGASPNYLQASFEKKIVSALKNGYRMSNGEYFKLDSGLPWGHKDRTVAYNLHAFKPLSTLLMGHSLLKRQDCFEMALTYVRDWMSQVRPPSEKELAGEWTNNDASNNDFLWYDMAIGMRAYRLAYIVDVLFRAHEPDLELLKTLVKILDWHRQILIRDETFSGHNNHGLYQACGQIIMARRFTDIPGMEDALIQGLERFDGMMNQQFFHEGVHREHSPGYHWMILGTLGEAMRSGILTKDEHILHLNRIEDSMAWFIQPNLRLAAFGDTDVGGINTTDLNPNDYTHPHLRYVLSGGRLGVPPVSPIKYFDESGYAVFRVAAGKHSAHACYLAQHAGFHSMTHKHADHLSIIWHDKNTDILVDAGRYSYQGKTLAGSDLWADGFWYSDPSRVYVESTRAHNTVEIDGRNHARRGAKPFGNALKRHASTPCGVHAIESECKHFKSIVHSRILFVKPGKFLIVLDWLKDNVKTQDHTWRQWFHLGKDLDLTASGDVIDVTREDAAFMRVCPLLQGTSLEAPIKGQMEPQIQGWVSHDRDALLEPNWAFAYQAGPSNSTCMATLFSLDPQASVSSYGDVISSGRKGTLMWQDSSGSHRIYFERPTEGEMRIAYGQNEKPES